MTAPTIEVPFLYDDGGRAASGRKGDAGDCVTRAICIAGRLDYDEVYAIMADGQARLRGKRSARNGVHPKVYRPYIESLGWAWTPTMTIGGGCTVHVRPEELPAEGRHVLRLSKHLAAWVDGTLRDTHDSSRGGTRCVYGYWTAP
jgi:hypothetical protein